MPGSWVLEMWLVQLRNCTLVSFSLDINSHVWLVTTILDIAATEDTNMLMRIWTGSVGAVRREEITQPGPVPGIQASWLMTRRGLRDPPLRRFKVHHKLFSHLISHFQPSVPSELKPSLLSMYKLPKIFFFLLLPKKIPFHPLRSNPKACLEIPGQYHFHLAPLSQCPVRLYLGRKYQGPGREDVVGKWKTRTWSSTDWMWIPV